MSKWRERSVFLFVIAVLVVVIVLLRECGGGSGTGCDGTVTTVTVTDTIPGDTVFETIYEGVPDPYAVYYPEYLTDTITDTIEVDTAAIIKNYLASRYYSDTFFEAGNYELVVNDSISENRITGRSIWFKNLRPVVVNHTTYTMASAKPRVKFFISASLEVGARHFDFAPGAMVLTKKGRGYGYEYKVLSNTHEARYYQLIRFKKKVQWPPRLL